MQIVKFMLTTIATLIVRSVLNKAYLWITGAFAAVMYYLYPAIEAVYIAFALVAVLQVVVNATHMAWEAYWLFTTAIKAEKLYAEASKLDPRFSWTTEAWTQAEEAHNELYGRMYQLQNNFLFKSQLEVVKIQQHNIDQTRRICAQSRVNDREVTLAAVAQRRHY
jgi:hypothetical protein